MTTTMTKPILGGRIKFGYWFNLLHARLYRRIDLVITAFQLVMGSYVINGLIKEFTTVEAYVAAIVVLVGVAQQLLMLQASKAIHQMAANDYLALEKDLDYIDCDTAAKRLYDLYSKYPDGLDCIQQLAHRIVDENFAPERQPRKLSTLASIVDCIV